MKLTTQAIAQWQFPALPAESAQGTGQVIFKMLLHDDNVWLALQGLGSVLVIPAIPLEKQGTLNKPKDSFSFTTADLRPEDCSGSIEEKAGKAHGSVPVQVIVSEEGKVLAARAISGHPLLHDASVKAALQ